MNTENKRTAKEYKLSFDNHFSIQSKYGALDKNNPEILHIRSKATITPSVNKKDFSEDIIFLKREFEKNVKQTLINSYDFENKHICSIEMSENGIAFGKKSHVKYDVYIKPKFQKKLKEYNNDILRLVYNFNQNLTELLTNCEIEIIG